MPERRAIRPERRREPARVQAAHALEWLAVAALACFAVTGSHTAAVTMLAAFVLAGLLDHRS